MSFHHKKHGYLPPPQLAESLRLFTVEMNPYCHRVQLVLDAKMAPYETYELDPLSLPNWFKEKNPRLKIPVLEVPRSEGDRYLFESVVICDYLDDKYHKNPLHSTDPYVKALDRLLIERFNDLIKGSLECFDTKFAFGGEQILNTVDVLEKELNFRDSIYFGGGSSPGMVDYMIWPWLERLYLLQCVAPHKFNEKKRDYPSFAEWGVRMQQDEVVKKHAKTPQQYLEYYKDAHTHTTHTMDYNL